MQTLKGVRVEIRPGEGGEDAARFAQELASSFTAFIRRQRSTAERRDSDRTLVLLVDGAAGSALEAFAGVHRIQRIPPNDKRGRRHTSTASVAVLPLRAAGGPELREADIQETAARGSGPGGQHRNTSDTKIRAVHRPTGLTVTVNRGRSQWQNRKLAREELARRLASEALASEAAAIDRTRADQIASSERSAKTFTHNTQRNAVVDHETGRRWRLDQFQAGRLVD